MQIRAWATPVTIGSFVLVAVTGLLMFFELSDVGFVKPAHEFLSLSFVAGSLFHIYANWKPLLNHLRQRKGRVIVGAFVLMTLIVLLPLAPKNNPHDGARKSEAVLLNASLPVLAALTNQDEAKLTSSLQSAGIPVNSKESIQALALQAHQDPHHVLQIALQNFTFSAPAEED